MRPNPFRECLDGLNEAEDAWFRDEGVMAYALWAKANTGLLRGALAMLADEKDEARKRLAVETSDKASPELPAVYN